MKSWYAKFSLCVLVLPLLAACNFSSLPTVQIADKATYEIRIADTPELREQGLSGSLLNESEGMLFVFTEPQKVSFWMKDMLIPLDLLYIDENLKVIEIFADLSPCTKLDCPAYASSEPVKYVLEVEAGETFSKEIEVGDEVKLLHRKA